MPDQPDEARQNRETAGGWFVPKNALTEQQVAELSAGQTSSAVPLPDQSSPKSSGEWYVPPEAASRVAALKTASQPAKTDGDGAKKQNGAKKQDTPAASSTDGGDIDKPAQVSGPASAAPDKPAQASAAAKAASKSQLPEGAA